LGGSGDRKRAHVPVTLSDGHSVEVIAHRGASAHEPEQTRAAYLAALAADADALECDVRLTADQVAVCLHDSSLRRVAGVDRSVSSLSLSQLRQLDLGRTAPPGSTAEPADRRVLTFEELCELAIDAGRPVGLAVEAKHPSRFGGAVERVMVDVLDRFGLRGRDARGVPTAESERVTVRFMSFSQTALERMARLAPGLDRVFLTDSGPLSWPWGRHLPGGAVVAAPSVRMLRTQPEVVQGWQQAGRRIHVWTVNTAEDVEMCVRARVDGVITDDPAGIAAMLADHARG
jgi:glycerophosphoryl diester phosphodiesterase